MKVTNVNSLRVILSSRVRSILESYPISGLPRGTAKSFNQADVCYYINLQVDMAVKKGIYNGGSVDIAF